MKRNTQRHPKVKRLSRLLGINRAHAVGLLELLWQMTAQTCPRGDIGHQNEDADIAEELFWEGEPKALIDALVESGWLDRCEEHRLVVHDWPDHADQTVHRTKAVQERQFAVAKQPASSKLVSDEDLTRLPETGNRKPETRNR